VSSTNRARRFIIATLVGVSACASSSTGPGPSPVEFSGTTRVVLRAWEDTRAGLPPLAITRADSVEAFLAFIRSKSDGWRAAGDSLPGIALPAELYVGTALQGRFAMLDLPGDTGMFVSWRGSERSLRPATDAELGQFLAYFGIAVTVVE
jgi:hypothetical protein